MADFLTHYYRKDKPPFQSMSYLSDDEAQRIGIDLLEENPDVFCRFRKFSTYWPRRRRTEQWVRSEFEKKGGRPEEPYPQCLVLGTSRYISELGNDGGYLKLHIPLSEFRSEEVSFTYSDSMVSLWLREERQDQPYFNPDLHGKVFTLAEILDVVKAHGIPDGEWKIDARKSYDFFVEAQVWSFRPLKSRLDEYTEGTHRAFCEKSTKTLRAFAKSLRGFVTKVPDRQTPLMPEDSCQSL